MFIFGFKESVARNIQRLTIPIPTHMANLLRQNPFFNLLVSWYKKDYTYNMLKKRLSYRNSEMANSTRTASTAEGLVKGLGVNPMRTFSANALRVTSY